MELFQPLNITEPIASFLSGLEKGESGFSDIMDSESQKSTARIIKVDNMTYKVDQDANSTNLTSNTIENSDSITPTAETEKSEIIIEDKNDPAVPIFQFHIAPLDSMPFIAQLPQHLTSFIKEMVVIIKQYNASIKAYDYKFQFQNLDLNVLFSKQEDVLKIVISVNDKNLQNDLTKERQDMMVAFLQKELDNENIELEFDFFAYSEDDQSKDQQAQDNSEQNTENNDSNENDS